MTRHSTAAAAYESKAAQIAEQLEALQVLIAKHGDRFAADERNWGFAGDLDAVLGQLKQAAAMVGGPSAD